MLGLKIKASDFNAFVAECDRDGSGELSIEELKELLQEEARRVADMEAQAEAARAAERKVHSPPKRLAMGIYSLVNTTACQTMLYLAFVIVFQLLTETLRLKEEYYLDKMFSETFLKPDVEIETQGVTFESIRRPADFYEFMNHIFIAGLMSNAGPFCGDVGPPGSFRSWSLLGSADLVGFKGGCNDDTWPDGQGAFSHAGASGWLVNEYAERMDQFDWTEGIVITQARVNSLPASQCHSPILDHCYPDSNGLGATQNKSAFGFNWTNPSSPLDMPFQWMSAEEAGVDPMVTSAHAASFRPIMPGGFISVIIPFFSNIFLAEERGLAADVTDYRSSLVSAGNGTPNFFCVRLSWDGRHLHQLCDPNSPSGQPGGRTTGAVRAAIEEFVNDMKRAHYIDVATRSVTIMLPITSNSIGVRSRVRVMLETVSTGAILPSYDTQTRVIREESVTAMSFWVWIAAGFCVFFIVLEGVEIVGEGPSSYFTNMWNVMDWLNFSLFFMVFSSLTTVKTQLENPPCSPLCESIGYKDDWESMATMRQGKTFLSLCVCIQLLKVIKFASALVPKMGLAPSVLSKALPDLVFFGIVFAISMVAFSAMFYVALGPVMVDFNDNTASFISLGRALFGDFDIDDIMNNSSGYLNAVLFLAYLFVAVFILLSMFFAILGESQANLRDDERDARKAGEAVEEYGVFVEAYELGKRVLTKVPVAGERFKEAQRRKKEMADQALAAAAPGPSPMERMEARQLELTDLLTDLRARMDDLSSQVGQIGGGAPTKTCSKLAKVGARDAGELNEVMPLLQSIASALAVPTKSSGSRSRPHRAKGGNGKPVAQGGKGDKRTTSELATEDPYSSAIHRKHGDHGGGRPRELRSPGNEASLKSKHSSSAAKLLEA